MALKATASFKSYDESKGTLFSWIYRIAVNTVKDYLGRNLIKVEETDESPKPKVKYVKRFVITDSCGDYITDTQDSPEADLIEQDREVLVHRILNSRKFSQKDRDLYRYLVEDRDSDEIAELLGVTTANVYVLKSRLIKRLQAAVRMAA